MGLPSTDEQLKPGWRLGSSLAASEGREPDRLREPAGERALEIFVAAVGLVVLSPLFLAVAVGVKLSDRGPVFYRARRVGQHGRLFSLYKFRSMVVKADALGAGITHSADTRITPIGRVLRRTKLDELPQLINVLLGDMSIVGPRPEDPRYVSLYTPEQRQVLQVRPGITGAASLEYRNEERMLAGLEWETLYRSEIMPAKLALDLDYLRRRTLRSDIGLVLSTVATLFK